MIKTNKRNFTPTEIVDLFSGYVRPENLEILVAHLTYPELSECVIGFIEQDGDICFDVGDTALVRVRKK